MALKQSNDIKSVITEASNAYKLYLQNTNLNSDFAEFAALSYNDFCAALGRPDLTQQEVRRLVRKGHLQSLNLPPESCWVTFMAGYITSAANVN